MNGYMPTAQKRRLRRSLFANQKGRCAYCGRGLSMEARNYRKANHATLDHLMPLALGGTTDPDNLILCCRLCNIFKGHSTLEDFIFGLLWVWLYRNMPVLALELRRRWPVAGAA